MCSHFVKRLETQIGAVFCTCATMEQTKWPFGPMSNVQGVVSPSVHENRSRDQDLNTTALFSVVTYMFFLYIINVPQSRLGGWED